MYWLLHELDGRKANYSLYVSPTDGNPAIEECIDDTVCFYRPGGAEAFSPVSYDLLFAMRKRAIFIMKGLYLSGNCDSNASDQMGS